MKKLFTSLAALLIAITCLTGFALADDLDDSTITINGSASIEVAPDIVNVFLGVMETKDEISQAQSSANAKINAIIAALIENGVEAKDIATSSYMIYADYRYDYTENQEIFLGFTANCELSIRVRDVEKAGALIDLAFQAGANRLNSFDFSIEDNKAYHDEALTRAVADAAHRADVIAKAAGVQIQGIVSIKEVGEYIDDSTPRYAAMEGDGAGGAETQLYGGTLLVNANVSIVYGITNP